MFNTQLSLEYINVKVFSTLTLIKYVLNKIVNQEIYNK